MRRDPVLYGAYAGLLAGIVFLICTVASAVVSGDPAFAPLRLYASIPLQTYPALIGSTTGIVIGGIVHFGLSIIYGVIAALIVAFTPLSKSPVGTLSFGIFGGIALWLINMYAFAPALGVPWFTDENQFFQALWHIIFGLVIGAYLARAYAKQEEA